MCMLARRGIRGKPLLILKLGNRWKCIVNVTHGCLIPERQHRCPSYMWLGCITVCRGGKISPAFMYEIIKQKKKPINIAVRPALHTSSYSPNSWPSRQWEENGGSVVAICLIYSAYVLLHTPRNNFPTWPVRCVTAHILRNWWRFCSTFCN
jgi:hypothetical protein